MGPSPHLTVVNITVTENRVHKLLAGLEPHKASGSDQLQARLLEELASELALIYILFFQASLDQGIIPDEWKSVNVVPIYKKGHGSKPARELSTRLSDLHHLQDSRTHSQQHNYEAYRSLFYHKQMHNTDSGKGDHVRHSFCSQYRI